MAKRIDKDHIDKFHDYGLYVPTRTVSLDCAYGGEEEDELGVNHYMATKFVKNFHILETISNEPITVLLNTDGGDLWQGMAIHDTIKCSKCHVTMKVTGCANSVGSIILQAAGERVLKPFSSVMFHLGAPGPWGSNPYEAAMAANFELKYGKRLDEILYERIKTKFASVDKVFGWAKYNEMNFKGKCLMAQEAIDFGLADRIEEYPIP